MKLYEEIAVITGGYSGIGTTTVKKLLDIGAVSIVLGNEHKFAGRVVFRSLLNFGCGYMEEKKVFL